MTTSGYPGFLLTNTFDALNLKITKTRSDGEYPKMYWRDIWGNTLSESDTSGHMLNDYIYFAGKRIAYVTNTGSTYFYLTDQIGSVRKIADQNGVVCYDADYTPYGQQIYVPTNSCPAQPYLFAGMERDDNVFDYDFARYYSYRLGRFMSADPLGGSVLNPQSLNRYTYVLNDPINLVDPSGMEICDLAWDAPCGQYPWNLGGGGGGDDPWFGGGGGYGCDPDDVDCGWGIGIDLGWSGEGGQEPPSQGGTGTQPGPANPRGTLVCGLVITAQRSVIYIPCTVRNLVTIAQLTQQGGASLATAVAGYLVSTQFLASPQGQISQQLDNYTNCFNNNIGSNVAEDTAASGQQAVMEQADKYASPEGLNITEAPSSSPPLTVYSNGFINGWIATSRQCLAEFPLAALSNAYHGVTPDYSPPPF